jgi:hypothetical protein
MFSSSEPLVGAESTSPAHRAQVVSRSGVAAPPCHRVRENVMSLMNSWELNEVTFVGDNFTNLADEGCAGGR